MNKTLIKPRALQSKDRVGLVAPGARPYKPSDLNRAVRLVEAMDFVPVVGQHCMACLGHLAGSDEQRLHDFNGFVGDVSIAAIFCLTGGSGALALIDKIDFKTMAAAGKIFVGGDDNNAISIAANAKENLVTFCGPNLDEINSRTDMELFRDFLINKDENKNERTRSISVSTKNGEFDFCADYIPVPGVAEGSLLGGNLTALTSLLGTGFAPDLTDALLFIDDRDERTDILDRWFTMLVISNQLVNTTGIILGPFENCDSRGSFNLLSLEEDLSQRLIALNKPCRFDFPIGKTAMVPTGPKARFDATNGSLEFLESIFA